MGKKVVVVPKEEPKKSTVERLNKSVTAAVTETFKEKVKEEATREDESISAFARKSLKDEIYQDLHPEQNVEEIVNSGHAQRSEVQKKPLVRQEEVITQDNTVSVAGMNKYLKLLKVINNKQSRKAILNDMFEMNFEQDKVELIRTDGETWINISVPKWHGDITPFVAKFSTLLTLFATNKSKTASFAVKNNQVVINFSDGLSSNVYVMGTEEFPANIKSEEAQNIEHVIQIDGNSLRMLLRSIEYAQNDDPTIKSLHAANFEIENGKLVLTATDGFRLARLEYIVKNEKPYKFLLRSEDIYALIDILAEIKNTAVEIYAMEKYVEFRVGEVQLIVKKIDDQFPNISHVIPKDEDIQIRMDLKANAMYDALRSLASNYAKKDQIVFLTLLKKDQENLILSVKNSEIGMSEVKVPIHIELNTYKNEDTNDEDFKVAFHPEFLMQPLKLFSSYGYGTNSEFRVIFEFVGLQKPLIIKPDSPAKTFAIIMPIRI
ncbi:MAG: DNA polymerase III subunit beta [Candidatus Parvarchaeota archaeon]|nr:DNA polymerase III subunit beta [Candidatus Jingweiarchaeum tengchongense]MCW1306076.1 DNA polymerase III subunit beta [Candidatus Jingweiarchaeum tengchongense]